MMKYLLLTLEFLIKKINLFMVGPLASQLDFPKNLNFKDSKINISH